MDVFARVREVARRLWRVFRARDVVEVVRVLSPSFDERVQKKVDEAAAKRSWSYHLFWWRLDRVPFWVRNLLMTAEKGLEELRAFADEFQQRHEVLRRYFAGAPLGEEEKAAALRMIKRLDGAASRLAAVDVLIEEKPKTSFIYALNKALEAAGAPAIPEKASAEDVARHLASIDPSLALKALKDAEEYLKTEIMLITEAAKQAGR
jgi:hypothetical protein